MQTFLPYPDLRASCQVLDSPRLGKQRVETFQILRALTWPEYAWKNHPAVRMWRGFIPGLVAYGVENCREWTRRGNADTVLPQLLAWSGGQEPQDPPLPPWWGLEALHLSHRSALLRKDPAYYRPLFGPDEPDDLPYLWPPDVYPRWPVRRAGRELDLAGALQVLGLSEPRPGQAEAVAALQAGRDCVLVARPGTGGTTAGLLAGLVLPGTTRWVSPPDGPVTDLVPEVPLAPVRPPVEPAAPKEGAEDEERAEPVDKGPVARPPSEVDRAAMAAELEPPEFLFARAVEPLPIDAGLVVLDRADALDAPPLPADRPPVLAVVGRADAGQRAALAARLGLRDPLAAGGGWDPTDTWLAVEGPLTPAAKRRRLPELVRGLGPALVVVASRERLDRVVTSLAGAGLRAAGWAPGMRATRAAAAVGAWRSRRLDALVVVAGTDVPLGRARVRLLLTADPPALREQWRDAVAERSPERAVLLADADGPADVLAYAADPGCRRAALLAPFGEPVPVPCGRCERCAPLPAGPEPVSGRGAGAGAGRPAARRRASGSPGG